MAGTNRQEDGWHQSSLGRWFVDDPDPPVEVMRTPDDLHASRMTTDERQQRIDELRTLINHFSAPPHEAEEAVNRWRLELARQLQSAGHWQEAIHLIQQELLPSCVAGPDEHLRALAWGELADVLQERGELDEALRIRREEQLPVYERLGDVRSRLVCHAKIALIQLARGAEGDRDVAVGLLRAAEADARRLRIPEAEHILAIQEHFGLES